MALKINRSNSNWNKMIFKLYKELFRSNQIQFEWMLSLIKTQATRSQNRTGKLQSITEGYGVPEKTGMGFKKTSSIGSRAIQHVCQFLYQIILTSYKEIIISSIIQPSLEDGLCPKAVESHCMPNSCRGKRIGARCLEKIGSQRQK